MDPRLRFKLSHAVTDYDRKQSRRKGHNPYALAHYLGAVQQIESAVDAGAELRSAILRRMTGRLADVVLKAAGLERMTDAEARGIVS